LAKVADLIHYFSPIFQYTVWKNQEWGIARRIQRHAHPDDQHGLGLYAGIGIPKSGRNALLLNTVSKTMLSANFGRNCAIWQLVSTVPCRGSGFNS
jgi:hypothetical protein